jgi:hypothetical protein
MLTKILVIKGYKVEHINKHIVRFPVFVEGWRDEGPAKYDFWSQKKDEGGHKVT